MNILESLKADYQQFPHNQTYSLYAEDVFFKDPMTQFRGVNRYQTMIRFIETWFRNCTMQVHDIQQNGDRIRTDWTLSWNTPLPWKPHIAISGWSDLTINEQGLITSHIDHWHCSKLDVIKQHFS